MRHDPTFVKLLSRETGLSRKTIKRGLDDLIEAGYLERRDGGYVATLANSEPPADQARGLLTSAAIIPFGQSSQAKGPANE